MWLLTNYDAVNINQSYHNKIYEGLNAKFLKM